MLNPICIYWYTAQLKEIGSLNQDARQYSSRCEDDGEDDGVDDDDDLLEMTEVRRTRAKGKEISGP